MAEQGENRKIDPARKYATQDTAKVGSWKCSFCDKITNGGVYRLKQHLAGGFKSVTICPKVPDHVKEEVRNFMTKKAEAKATTMMEPDFAVYDDEEDEVEAQPTAPKPRKRKGPMDRFAFFNGGSRLGSPTLQAISGRLTPRCASRLFKLSAGFNYLVRLHFCEIVKEVTKTGQRIFSIVIGNQVAQPETDVISMSGGSRIPMFLDFGTFVASHTNKSREISTLRLDLYPYKDEYPTYYDGILNGIEILKLNDSHGTLVRYNPKIPIPTTLDVKKLHVVTIIFKVIGSAIGLLTFIFVVVFFMCRRKRKKNSKDNSVLMSKVLLNQYTYAQVKKITKSFSHIVGKGGFGTVYGGSLSNGRKVAIKLLKDSKGNGEDFINEVASMSQTSHVNIVSLLGFCFEGSKRAIVYEFLENGSLDRFISTLDVTTLYGIALGVARGVEYLHYGCKTRIVHFDIKPQNILLDGNLCPKVSDFGLAKLCEKRESIVSLIDGRGTIGYIAPEVFTGMYGTISHKSDVYSYGMLVFDMIGARNREVLKTTSSNASSVYFPDWIYEDLENGEQTWISGNDITEEDKDILKKMITVALWCIQLRPSNRPSMNKVVEMMEGSLYALEIPPKPPMHFSTELIAESSSLSIDEEVE